MTHPSLLSALLTACLALVGHVAFAANSPITAGSTADDDAPAWQEGPVPAPAAPALDKLAPFKLEMATNLRWALDANSVSLGRDGVIRYVLVATSDSGAANVLYEGIRCGTAEVRTYARWTAEAGWKDNESATWQPLAFRGATRRAMLMARGGLCDGKTLPSDARRAIRELQQGRNFMN